MLGISTVLGALAFNPALAASPVATLAPAAALGATGKTPGDDSIGPIEAPDATYEAGPAPEVSYDPWSQHSIDDPTSIWVVVNKARPLDPIDYVPGDLETVSGAQLTPEAADAMVAMREAAADAGAGFSLSNGYRPYSEQRYIYNGYVADLGQTLADRGSLRPGYSEHQTGLSADAYQSSTCRIQACFGSEAAGEWLAEHGHEFGYILRYPEGKDDITGIRYEPWHVRYVGVDLASALVESEQTMEEFFGLEAALTYR
ncbi:M15 family metallopeptidase [Demequina flava]|uniref:M15 family metallopeptidase n=1 Tax=Demequina flava TaxID=1095025 RepID=UPI0007844A21|nr:M15 family metallopeptidase [Demequina flava]